MRRVLHAAALSAALLLPAAARAGDGTAMLGGNGELYRVRTGTYASLFADAPAGAAGNPVLALDIEKNGGSRRVLVPGTDGLESERSPALTVDPATNEVYIVWEGQRGIHSVLDLISYSAEGFGDVFEFSGDPFSIKTNPQLATTLDAYQTLSDDGDVVTAKRTMLHLVWFDDGVLGERDLYSAIVIEDGSLLRTNTIFDLEELAADEATDGAAASAPAALVRKPEVRSGRDGQSVVVGFVGPQGGRLAALELRSVTGELVSFADKARASIIDTGHRNPDASRRALADKARASIIDTGRRLFRAEVAKFLTDTFLAVISGSTDEVTLEEAADEARASIIDTGVSLRRGITDRAHSKVVEIAQSETPGSVNHLLDVRRATRRDLPALPDSALRVFLSQSGDNTALAWPVEGAVQYRESAADGWGPVQTLTLSPALGVDDAYALVQQRVSSK